MYIQSVPILLHHIRSYPKCTATSKKLPDNFHVQYQFSNCA